MKYHQYVSSLDYLTIFAAVLRAVPKTGAKIVEN